MRLDPAGTAVLTMELQRGICGDLAALPALRDAVTEIGAATIAGAIAALARSAAVPVIHCTFSMRPDRLGAPLDLPMMGAARRDPDYLREGQTVCELLPELDLQPGDVIVDRHHGITPFHGTNLDPILRDLGVATVILVGVSLNVGIIGLAIDAVNHGYDVVVVREAVAGVPVEYGEAVLDNALAGIARVVSADQITFEPAEAI